MLGSAQGRPATLVAGESLLILPLFCAPRCIERHQRHSVHARAQLRRWALRSFARVAEHLLTGTVHFLPLAARGAGPDSGKCQQSVPWVPATLSCRVLGVRGGPKLVASCRSLPLLADAQRRTHVSAARLQAVGTASGGGRRPARLALVQLCSETLLTHGRSCGERFETTGTPADTSAAQASNITRFRARGSFY